MDPVTLIVAALVAGAAAGLKDTATSAVKSAYDALKGCILRRYGHVDVSDLERTPDSEEKRAAVLRGLTEAGARDDGELLELARQLYETVPAKDKQAAHVIGVEVSDIEAEFIRLGKVRGAVSVKRVKLKGGLDIGEVNAGGGTIPENP